MSLVIVNDDCGEGQWSSLKSCVLVYIYCGSYCRRGLVISEN